MAAASDEHALDLLVQRKEAVADGVVLLTLGNPAGAPLPEWQPGAHVDLVLGADLVRQYSLCGDLADRTSWQVAVLREPAGRGGSQHVHNDGLHLPAGTEGLTRTAEPVRSSAGTFRRASTLNSVSRSS